MFDLSVRSRAKDCIPGRTHRVSGINGNAPGASPKRRLAAWARRFLADECGTTLALTAALIIPIMGFVGLGVDASRAYLVKARLGEALDAAVLAAAHVTNGSGEVHHTAHLQAALKMYFEANFPPGYMGANVTLGNARVDSDKETLSVSASVELDATFMRLFGFQSLNINTETEVTMQTVSMDVALSVDMSGSMGNSDGAGSTRIAAARTAAHTLVDILYGNKSTSNELLIGLVPWNDKVNITLDGTTYNRSDVTTQSVPSFTNPWTGSSQTEIYYADNSPVPLLTRPSSGWDGCIFARYIDNWTNDDDADHLLAPVTTSDGTEWPAWQANDPGAGGDDDDDDDDEGPSPLPCLSQGITPLTDERNTIENAIDDLTSPTGATNIAQGLAWGWRVVSPGEPFDEADPFPTGLHERAVVLLTDGQQYGYTGDGYNGQFGSGSSAGANGMDDRLRAIAANMKAEGIKIYVIQFYYSSGPLQALLQEVATESQAPFYHFAADGDALNDAFKEIADDLSALRISK